MAYMRKSSVCGSSSCCRDDNDLWSLCHNEHLLTEGAEGYVQGMSDLCAPIYVVMGADEEITFWCFVQVMHTMVCLSLSCPVTAL